MAVWQLAPGVRGLVPGVRALISDFILRIVTSNIDFKVTGFRLMVNGRLLVVCLMGALAK